jgi:hypothetical protein
MDWGRGLSVRAAMDTCWMAFRNRDEVAEAAIWMVASQADNQFFNQWGWAAEPAFLQRVFRGQERLPVNGDQVPSSIDDLFDVCQSCLIHFVRTRSNTVDAVARGDDRTRSYSMATESWERW